MGTGGLNLPETQAATRLSSLITASVAPAVGLPYPHQQTLKAGIRFRPGTL